MIATRVLERIRQINTCTERVKTRRNAYLTAKVVVCTERSRIIMESGCETEGEPLVIRRVLDFKKVLEEIPIVIHDGELLNRGILLN